jgi:hypothetical protein
MKRLPMLITALATTLAPAIAMASDAETSATASSNRYQRDGTAAASARYDGQAGFARTNTRSGPVSTARGVAVGVDQDGLSFSISNAIAGQRGPALATTFNLSIGRDGRVSGGSGLALARGPVQRSATAAGRVGTGDVGRTASAFASGKTDRFGRVYAKTRSEQHRRRPVLVRRSAPSEVVRYRLNRR